MQEHALYILGALIMELPRSLSKIKILDIIISNYNVQAKFSLMG